MAAPSSRLQKHLLRLCARKAGIKQILFPQNISSTPAKSLVVRGKLSGRCALQKQLKNGFIPHQSCSHCLSTDPAQQTRVLTEVDPFQLIEQELHTLCDDIKAELVNSKKELQTITQYYFDGKGKSFRPAVVMLVSKALNSHTVASERLLPSQKRVAMIAEMIHTASLIQDDVIDDSKTRRGKESVHMTWGHRKAIFSGDFILSVACIALARIRNERVVTILSQVIEDLVRGEFMQLGSKEDEDERFAHYLKKTFKKTASLIANSCKAVAVLGDCSEQVAELAYNYGRNIGIAFQLIDDLLDFTSCEAVLGKPTAADLSLGLATAPVLFAAQEYSELHPMIMRRFSSEGDVMRARDLVAMSDGVAQTRMLAEKHSQEAIKLIRQLANSQTRIALEQIAELVLKRKK